MLRWILPISLLILMLLAAGCTQNPQTNITLPITTHSPQEVPQGETVSPTPAPEISQASATPSVESQPVNATQVPSETPVSPIVTQNTSAAVMGEPAQGAALPAANITPEMAEVQNSSITEVNNRSPTTILPDVNVTAMVTEAQATEASSTAVPTIPEVIGTILPTYANGTIIPDKNHIFREEILARLDELQDAKDGVLLTHMAEAYDQIEPKVTIMKKVINQYRKLNNTPSKMDYVRQNYWDYLDQLDNFAQTFTDGSKRYAVGDRNSGNSMFDAGIIAADRADICVKRIKIFFDEHVPVSS